jgi:NADPH:quinone reductase-like Zn-dependent oxidoreductase
VWSVKAVVYDRYGPPDVLRIANVPKPSPAARQVLVKVAATSINLSDWETLRGTPAYSRIGGLRRPARRIRGSDIAGRVDAVGPGVTRWRPGDEVYGDNLALADIRVSFASNFIAAISASKNLTEGFSAAQSSEVAMRSAGRLSSWRRRPARAVWLPAIPTKSQISGTNRTGRDTR